MTAKSGIRALRPTHLVALRALDNRGTVAELTAPSWPRVADGDGSLPLWSLLSHAMAHSTGLRRAWVHLADDAIDGIAIARVRCGGLVCRLGVNGHTILLPLSGKVCGKFPQPWPEGNAPMR